MSHEEGICMAPGRRTRRRMKNSAAGSSAPRETYFGSKLWIISGFSAIQGKAKLALPVKQHLKCGIFCFPGTKPPKFRKDGFSAVRFHVSSTVFLG